MKVEDCSLCAYLEDKDYEFNCNGKPCIEHGTDAICPYVNKSIFSLDSCPKLKQIKESEV